jgi:HEAT repeat protein
MIGRIMIGAPASTLIITPIPASASTFPYDPHLKGEPMPPLFGPPNIEKLKARRDVKGLIKALSYPKDAEIRLQAVQALGEIGDARAVSPLFAAHKDKDRKVSWAATDALVKIASRSIEPFIPALNDSSRDVRYLAVYCLGSTGDPRAVEPLREALKDSDPLVRQNVASSLGKIPVASAVDALISALGDTDKHVRGNAADALGKSGDPRAVDQLISLVHDDWYAVRVIAIEVLAKIGDARAIKPLIDSLGDKDGRVRKSAAKALVALYTGDTLQQEVKHQVLALRKAFETPHFDHVYCWSDGHTTHTDDGIGIDFPL